MMSITSQAISHPGTPVAISRRPGLVGLAAFATVVVAAVIVALAFGSTGNSAISAGHSASATSLPQVRDLAPTPQAAAQVLRASAPAGYVRDPSTHALLKIQIGSPLASSAPQVTTGHREGLIRLGR
jgi:hypothetical protein